MLPSDRGQPLGQTRQTSGFRNEKMAIKQNHDETKQNFRWLFWLLIWVFVTALFRDNAVDPRTTSVLKLHCFENWLNFLEAQVQNSSTYSS